MTINNIDADIEICPEEFAKILQSIKTALKNPFRDTEKSRSKNIQNSSNTSIPFPSSYYNFYSSYNHSIYPPYSLESFPYHQ